MHRIKIGPFTVTQNTNGVVQIDQAPGTAVEHYLIEDMAANLVATALKGIDAAGFDGLARDEQADFGPSFGTEDIMMVAQELLDSNFHHGWEVLIRMTIEVQPDHEQWLMRRVKNSHYADYVEYAPSYATHHIWGYCPSHGWWRAQDNQDFEYGPWLSCGKPTDLRLFEMLHTVNDLLRLR